jgi:hypothetical protein
VGSNSAVNGRGGSNSAIISVCIVPFWRIFRAGEGAKHLSNVPKTGLMEETGKAREGA